MKQKLALACIVVAAPGLALGQTAGAQVFFSNKAVGAPVDDANGNALLGSNYSAELFYGTGSDPSTFVGLDNSISSFYPDTLSLRAGFWNGGTIDKFFPAGVDQGLPINVQVRVWNSSLFSTWSAAAVEAANLAANPANVSLASFQQGVSSVFSFTPPTDNQLITPGAAYLTGLSSFKLSQFSLSVTAGSQVFFSNQAVGAPVNNAFGGKLTGVRYSA